MVNSCPSGYTMRKGYTRKYRNSVSKSGFTVRRKGTTYTVHPKQTSIVIPSTCIKAKRRNNSIGKLRKGDLIKYGYQYRLSDSLREKALKRAIAIYGALSVYKKLDTISKLSEKSVPDASNIFLKDRDWIYQHYKLR